MYSELITQIFETALIPLIIAIASFVIKWLNAKSTFLRQQTDNAVLQKYISLLDDSISKCVTATSQTYVDSLKNQDAFDKEAQKEAFKMSYQAILATLNEEATIYLTNLYGDLEIYITSAIEATIKESKEKE